MATKLLLLDDVEGLGRKGDVVSARPGYIRNFLIPQQLAVIADSYTLRMQERLKQERDQRALVDKKESEELAARIQDTTHATMVKVDPEGHMYGSVAAVDIVHLLQKEAGITIERRMILLPHPIKEIGVHTIKLKLKEGVPASFTLKVVPEETEQANLA